MILNQISADIKGHIFDIQGLSVHDGPGCRTLIFLNGCTLNCFWCSNPEGLSVKPTLMYFQDKCILCGKCVENCSHNAINIDANILSISHSICSNCESIDCLKECYTDALKLSSYQKSVSDVFKILNRDRQFWGNKGGVTLSGGEPLVQIEFVQQLLKKCYESYIHTAIETCGNVPWKNYEQVIPYLDWIFFDLKHLNTQEHKKGTHADNTLILENARKIASAFKGKLIFRMPLIPKFNDSEINLSETISFLKELGKNEINILPLHHLGREKYKVLSRDYLSGDYPTPSKELLKKVKSVFLNAGINCYIGSETPF